MSLTESKRPLSPHLQVYRLPYNAVMSITGRAVGVVLYIAAVIIATWFCLSVWNPAFFDATMTFLSTGIMQTITTPVLLFGAFTTFFYIGNGIRHVLWDMLIGVNVKAGEMTGHVVLVLSALLTGALAALIYM